MLHCPYWRENRERIVSILTRPEGRVLPKIITDGPGGKMRFNPHPSRGAGATDRFLEYDWQIEPFQSSPVPRGGCYAA